MEKKAVEKDLYKLKAGVGSSGTSSGRCWHPFFVPEHLKLRVYVWETIVPACQERGKARRLLRKPMNFRLQHIDDCVKGSHAGERTQELDQPRLGDVGVVRSRIARLERNGNSGQKVTGLSRFVTHHPYRPTTRHLDHQSPNLLKHT
jgi:hypothetical protein